ncbi:hypothetical protein [Bradyrhizobium sp. 169]|uniref:hypothetical protein n=1 Tax=Bradyrhizobium sp. 169 TaxID=2782640 RepID=UPI001FF779A0|nr:hypothetical protein [Bradyrhizobium sp. 169]MCK1592957.1 hypothetical protein [Bradyrhizobium sp. 169]
MLHTTGTVHDGSTHRYRASKFDCDACALMKRCCPNKATLALDAGAWCRRGSSAHRLSNLARRQAETPFIGLSRFPELAQIIAGVRFADSIEVIPTQQATPLDRLRHPIQA